MRGKTDKRRIPGLIPALILALTLIVSGWVSAPAAAAEDAIDMTVIYSITNADAQSMTFKLYQVGKVENGVFTLDEPYAASGVSTDFTKDTPDAEWMASADTLFQYIKTNGLAGTAVQEKNPDSNGEMVFSLEKKILYLIATDDTVRTTDIIYGAKPSYLWCTEGEEQTFKIKPAEEAIDMNAYTVVKHWNNDTAGSRPKEIKVALYENGKLVETVSLNQSNNWTYSWKDQDAEGKWTCVEQNVPTGYTCRVQTAKNGAMFVVTNTKTGSKQTTPAKKVKTGDQMTYIWGVIALIAAGIVLIVIGVRRRKE